jgi:ribonuclease HI
VINDAEVINESRKSRETLVNEIKILKETIKRTANMLKQKQKIEQLDKEIKNLELKWRKGDQGDKLYNEHIYYKINALKKQRSDVS